MRNGGPTALLTAMSVLAIRVWARDVSACASRNWRRMRCLMAGFEHVNFCDNARAHAFIFESLSMVAMSDKNRVASSGNS